MKTIISRTGNENAKTKGEFPMVKTKKWQNQQSNLKLEIFKENFKKINPENEENHFWNFNVRSYFIQLSS